MCGSLCYICFFCFLALFLLVLFTSYLIFFNYFCSFTVQSLPPSWSALPQFLIPFLLPTVSKRMFHFTSPPGLHTPGASSLQGQAHLLPLRPDQAVLCCMCVGGLRPAHVCCLVGGSGSERSPGSRLVETAGLPMGLPSSSPSSSFPLIQSQGSLTSV